MSEADGQGSIRPKPRVLVIDDEPALAQTLSFLLRDEHDVTLAHSGKSALNVLAQRQDFDAILCDLTMPQVSGIDVYDWLKANHPGLEERILFMTGGTFTPRAAQFVASVANPTVEKPFAIEQLLGLIAAIVSRSRQAQGPASP